MGKKKSGNDAPKPTAFVLKVPMHCRCDGCADKIRAAVKDLTLRCDGIVSLDQSALDTKGDLAVVATADPERLRRRLRKATGKDVGLVFPKPTKADGGKDKDKDAVQALLAGLQQQQQPVHAHPMPAVGTWNALQYGGYGQAAYPWGVLQQQQAPYLASYPAAAYPAASWAAYPHGGGWLGF
ncbi:heavy metal-associated isoprenylated plant protein 3 [Sorghum bicolor]|uniref:HMA domain-containing protein n=1 Tax=Sorghum bicolor TaxID=4558 RepID=C5XVX5_SORBI|nr:heavy metal-associated isoprenylated plant protein 3 [Sorghum bicolor]EES06020.1 hypothetical protein SORBI_3004G346400 [Sorghum bicolor]|eukprot:XP_002453044.1 heavy metal-associated isoprenylated plant protein 3 [Sorghum bicolor]